MLNNFRNLQSLLGSHGSRWLLFRVAYALRRRTGYIRLQMPQYKWEDRPLATWLRKDIPSAPSAYTQWRKQNSPVFFPGVDEARFSDSILRNAPSAVQDAERILSGEIKYFSHSYYPIGFPPDWHKDPVTGIRLDSQKHWSEISNDSELDIKFIWEPGRFAMVYPLARAYSATRDERYAEAFWRLIQSWAASNPPNTGPHWMDGQEAALRLMAWTFGFHTFLDSPATTPERVAQFVVIVAAHAERIEKNLDYAISTQSNHTISEAFGLWLAGTLFPELKDGEAYERRGRRLLEQEAAAQILPDGSYSMFALNYHRFILHLYLYAIQLGEWNRAPFSEALKNRIGKSIDYLSQLIDPETGKMPVYGSNDGALVLPLNDCDFTDYRPLLQLGSYITKKQLLLEPGPWDEDVFWLCGQNALAPHPASGGRKITNQEETAFPYGGTYLLRGSHSKAMIRCADLRSRPSHADQLHVDLWIRGTNIAVDAGTYLYSGPEPWRNGLAHTSVHNTVTVDGQDQMDKLTRFTWTNWSHGKVLRRDQNLWQGEHDGYKRLADPVAHKRTVLSLAGDRWLVLDHLTAQKSHHYALHWLLCNGAHGIQELPSRFGLWLTPSDSRLPESKVLIQMGSLQGQGDFSVVSADPSSGRGWRSQYYADKEPAISAKLETDGSNAVFWSYFGMETDTLEIVGTTLSVRSGEWKTTVDLDRLNP